MTEDKLAEVAMRAIIRMSDILDIISDNDNYPTKEMAYDAIIDYLVEKGELELC